MNDDSSFEEAQQEAASKRKEAPSSSEEDEEEPVVVTKVRKLGKPKRGDDDDCSSSSDEEEVEVIEREKVAAATAPAREVPPAATATPRVVLTSAGAAATGPNSAAAAPGPTARRTSSASTAQNSAARRGATTTSRSRKSKGPAPKRIAKGCRVKVVKSLLYHAVQNEEQQAAIACYGKNRNCYGNTKSGKGQDWVITFDDFPASNKTATIVRKKINLVATEEEERAYDHGNTAEIDDLHEVRKALSPEELSSVDEFCSLDDDTVQRKRKYVQKYGKEDGESIEWKIYGDTEFIKEADDPMQYPKDAKYHKDIDPDEPFADTFFKHFFPDIRGHAKIIDEFLKDARCSMRDTVMHDKIKFHDADAADPDWKVKQGYLLLIAASSEVHVGMDKLWMKGPSLGRHEYPDFGQFMPLNEFKAFRLAALRCWCDKKNWFVESFHQTWNIFLPVLKSYNERRQELLSTVLLLLDESMSGWRPKTSKLGGLPNYTFEKRKPVPLGTMFRNGVECITGMIVFQDIVQGAESQHRKEFHGDNSSMPNGCKISAHTAEVMRQVKGAKVVPGGWVGGDAWFGSVMTAVEVMKEFDVHSTWIVKGNTAFYPMRVLHRLLIARHGNRPAGHWTTMTTTISGVHVIAMAYAWSQRGVSYFVSTCGSTEVADDPYYTKFEDEDGTVNSKEIKRPKLAEFLFLFLPLIDEHNKQRQAILALERCWPTKDAFFRLIITLVGMTVVDMHRWHRNIKSKTAMDITFECFEDSVRNFSDLICKSLKPRVRLSVPNRVNTAGLGPLVRITYEEGSTTREPTSKQQTNESRSTGTAVVRACYPCRKYPTERRGQQQTQWKCRYCAMPICQKDHSSGTNVDPRRKQSCLQEHQVSSSGDPLYCNVLKHFRKGSIFPKGSIVCLPCDEM
jgi:hypothetical protein